VTTAVVVGGFTGRYTGRSQLRTALRQVLFTLVPAGITYAIGSLVGVSV
jgi:VIT1/CCC1 family predicted Fe2+/Mn2+ transporter